MKKVLIITYYWPPSGGAGVQRWLKFTKYLPQSGIEPIVLTVDASQASYPVRDQGLEADVLPGIRVIRTSSFEPLGMLAKIKKGNAIPYGGFANRGKEKFSEKVMRFIRGNFFIPDARKGWVHYAFREACRVIEEEKIDTVVISSPPHSSQLIGLKLKKRFPSVRWIADMRDPWTDIYYYPRLLHTPLARKIDRSYEVKTLETADEVVVVSESIRQMFLSKSPQIHAKKIHVIPNGYDEDDFRNPEPPDREKFVISYVGTMADEYHPEVFFEALKALKESHGNKVLFHMVGSCPDKIKSQVTERGLDDIVKYTAHVPHAEAVRMMMRSSALLLVIPDVENNKGILTGKLFEYLGSGRPVICIAPPEGDAAKIIKECNAGLIFNQNQCDELLDYMNILIRTQTNGFSITKREKFSRSRLAKEMSLIILK